MFMTLFQNTGLNELLLCVPGSHPFKEPLPPQEPDVLDTLMSQPPRGPQPGYPTSPSSEGGQSSSPFTPNAPSGELETPDPPHKPAHGFGLWSI